MAESIIPHIGRIAGEAAPDMAAAVDQRQRGTAEQRGGQLGFRLVRAAAHQWRVEGAMTGEAQGVASRRRSEEHTSELQSLMRIPYAVFCLKKKKLEQ